MKRSAIIWLSFQSEKHLKTILNSMKPETRESPSCRSRTKAEEEDGRLLIKFDAKDTSALRAAINAYLRWVALVQNALETVDDISAKKDDENPSSLH